MTPGMRALLVLVAVAILIAAWRNRFDTLRANDSSVFVADRWTGSLRWCGVGASTCITLSPKTTLPASLQNSN